MKNYNITPRRQALINFINTINTTIHPSYKLVGQYEETQSLILTDLAPKLNLSNQKSYVLALTICCTSWPDVKTREDAIRKVLNMPLPS